MQPTVPYSSEDPIAAHTLHVRLGEALGHVVSLPWSTAEEHTASLLAVQQISPDRVTPISVAHLDYQVRSFPSPIGGRALLEIAPSRRETLPLPAHERAILWSDEDLVEGARPQHYVFPSARAAQAFDQTLAQIEGWFQAQPVPGPCFVDIANAQSLEAHLAEAGEDPGLLARYRAAQPQFPANGRIWLDPTNGQWVAHGWQPGAPVNTLAAAPRNVRRTRRP